MTFRAGHDPRRYNSNGELTKYHETLRQHLRDYSLDAVDFMVATMKNDKAPIKLRLVAAKEILDRGLGRPMDVIAVQQVTGDTGKTVNQLSDQALIDLVSQEVAGRATIEHESN